jgi:predicted metal-dependent peptidase
MTDSQDLTRRVLDAVPAGSYAMQALLSLARIEVSTDVPTAAVSCERRPALLINPGFVAEHCRTDEHLFMLVMHELYHVLLGHTRLYRVMTPAHNLAFDAVINAMLFARFPAVPYTSFFTALYAEESTALRLLAPPGKSHLMASTSLSMTAPTSARSLKPASGISPTTT